MFFFFEKWVINRFNTYKLYDTTQDKEYNPNVI